MRVLVQRVSRAEVRVVGAASPASSIGKGLVVLVGVGRKDDEAAARKLAEKTANLRIFSNDEGKFDLSLLDVRGEALVVSQFTLYGNCARGRRPDFTAAMPPERAAVLYEGFVAALRGLGLPVKTGEFRAVMEVELVNDGPVTLWLDCEEV
ncbi:MAG: D-tyrosyl-tRNA(Tyr) deacylase [Elusimicrobia bacterium GWA2_69_24]|nr:MAG: D-tyrosyl-tRNA(Tyr) deacylase [Elusimicrobia bacterium GWA2_69_24]HBL17572.1 D-tyrosyl-tRNA(Tyr) deacylase [Elusimicrobiota bacterium]